MYVRRYACTYVLSPLYEVHNLPNIFRILTNSVGVRPNHPLFAKAPPPTNKHTNNYGKLDTPQTGLGAIPINLKMKQNQDNI